MHRDFLVFWSVDVIRQRGEPQVVRVNYPPHEEPKGTILEDLLRAAIPYAGYPVSIDGAMQLPPQRLGMSLDLATGTGHIASVECYAAGWRVVM